MGQRRFQIFLKSDKSPIELYLASEVTAPDADGNSSDSVPPAGSESSTSATERVKTAGTPNGRSKSTAKSTVHPATVASLSRLNAAGESQKNAVEKAAMKGLVKLTPPALSLSLADALNLGRPGWCWTFRVALIYLLPGKRSHETHWLT